MMVVRKRQFEQLGIGGWMVVTRAVALVGKCFSLLWLVLLMS